MNYNEAVEFVKKSYDKEIRLGLERITKLLVHLENPQKKLKFVHVAGTNGKGSVCAMTAEILKQAGYKTGLFTSPVISDYKEQFCINGEPISEEAFVELVEILEKACQLMPDPPSEFEKACALAFLYFNKSNCDFVVLEVGMGGDSDATNVIDCPEVAAITGIDYDHMSFLGDSLVEIAEKKAGIIKSGCKVVVADQRDEIMDYFFKRCIEMNCEYVRTSVKNITPVEHSLRGQIFDYKAYRGIELRLLGKHQCENAAVVLEIIDCLIDKGYHISDDDVYNGMKEVCWPGRFEVISENPAFIIDGAHNPNGIDAFCSNLDNYFAGERFIFIVGILRDKDYKDMLLKLIPYAKSFVTIAPNNPRAMTPYECAGAIKQAGYSGDITIEYDYDRAIESARHLAGQDYAICLVGSLYNIGEIRKRIL